MHFTSTDDTTAGIVERSFTVDDIPGVLWSPVDTPPTPALILMGHGGSLNKRHRGIVHRAHHYVTNHGFTVAAIDAPGHGDRPRSAEDQRWVAALRTARANREPIAPIIPDFNASLAERAVPEWRRVLDELCALPEIAGYPIGYAGLTLGTAIGIPLTAADSRISAAVFGGYFAYASLLDAARQITVPIELLLSWDDVEIPRDEGLLLFDAFASADKTLRAHVGGHKRVPAIEADNTARFFARQLMDQPVRA